jgi:hypothetical protein
MDSITTKFVDKIVIMYDDNNNNKAFQTSQKVFQFADSPFSIVPSIWSQDSIVVEWK